MMILQSNTHNDTSLFREMRQIVAPFNRRNPAIYWFDFLVCLAIGYGAASYYLMQPFGNWPTIAAFLISGLALYRVTMHIHEINHFRPGEMRAFQVTWNLLAGIPMLMPSFFYESHRSHHNTHDYGTSHDAEYLPLACKRWPALVKFLAEVFLLPPYFVARFALGTPISTLFPSTREWMLRRWSSFAINLTYEHEVRKDAPRKLWLLIEWGCFLRIALFVGLVCLEMAPATRAIKLYSLAVFTLSINHFRTLSAHRYANPGDPISHTDQFLDSTNITGGWFTELICPLATRYHALHHLFPLLPYHQLPRAHRSLIDRLPPDSPYHQATFPTMSAAISELLTHIFRPYREGAA